MQCLLCNKEFEAKRKTAKYCSNKCKMKARHAKSDTVKLDTLTDTLKPEAVTALDTLTDDKLVCIDGVPKCVLTVNESSPGWKKELSYLEHIHWLKDTPLKILEQSYAFIPCWRYALG